MVPFQALNNGWAYFGYVPLLAETFTDLEAFAGTSYKAAGWIPLGRTKGSGTGRTFSCPTTGPRSSGSSRCGRTRWRCWVPRNCRRPISRAAKSSAHGVMPLRQPQIESLQDHLSRVSDPARGQPRISYRRGAFDCRHGALERATGHQPDHAVWLAIDSGATQKPGIAAQGRQEVLPGTRLQGVLQPVVQTLRNPDTLAESLSAWLRLHSGTLPSSLALDGKMIRETVGIVCLADHETGVPHAMASMSMKEGEGDRCELKTAQKLIATLPDLNHKLVTADALHCQAATAQAIVAQGGDYLLQKGQGQPPKTCAPWRKWAWPVCPVRKRTRSRNPPPDRPKSVDPLDVHFPHVQTVLQVRRHTSTKKKAAAGEDAYYQEQPPADSKTPEQWLQTIRDHWAGVELRNHWRKDACLFEDKTRAASPTLWAT